MYATVHVYNGQDTLCKAPENTAMFTGQPVVEEAKVMDMTQRDRYRETDTERQTKRDRRRETDTDRQTQRDRHRETDITLIYIIYVLYGYRRHKDKSEVVSILAAAKLTVIHLIHLHTPNL